MTTLEEVECTCRIRICLHAVGFHLISTLVLCLVPFNPSMSSLCSLTFVLDLLRNNFVAAWAEMHDSL